MTKKTKITEIEKVVFHSLSPGNCPGFGFLKLTRLLSNPSTTANSCLTSPPTTPFPPSLTPGATGNWISAAGLTTVAAATTTIITTEKTGQQFPATGDGSILTPLTVSDYYLGKSH